jgi:uncharacterized protein YqjF (DUF2071 family)
MKQEWHKLLFAHWPLPPDLLRPLVPPMLPLDTYDGQCWVAVTPFVVRGLRARRWPPVPGTSVFPELNVRTYVTVNGKPGVFFFSLDAGVLSAVFGARLLYALPYYYARMAVDIQGEEVTYRCRRTHMGRVSEFEAQYRPVSPAQTAVPGSLEHFLTERYCLYAPEGQRLYCAEIHHLPWPLQAATAEITRNTMAEAAAIFLPAKPPLLHFARQLEVLVWSPQRLL